MFSDPQNPYAKDTTTHLPITSLSFDSFDFNETDIIQAIDEIYPRSSTSDNDIPAKIPV